MSNHYSYFLVLATIDSPWVRCGVFDAQIGPSWQTSGLYQYVKTYGGGAKVDDDDTPRSEDAFVELEAELHGQQALLLLSKQDNTWHVVYVVLELQ
jgi:hypothetical protein